MDDQEHNRLLTELEEEVMYLVNGLLGISFQMLGKSREVMIPHGAVLKEDGEEELVVGIAELPADDRPVSLDRCHPVTPPDRREAGARFSRPSRGLG